MAGLKHLWRGTFNRSREILVLRTYAPTKRSAWIHFCHQIARRDCIHVSRVMGIFDGSKDNYKIDLEVEFEEGGDE